LWLAYNKRFRLRFCQLTLMLFLVVIWKAIPGYTKETPCQNPEVLSVVDLACRNILAGDFKGASQVLRNNSAVGCESLGQLREIVDEYKAINSHRLASKNAVYREQIEELKKHAQKPVPEDTHSIGEVLAVIVKASEYANEGERHQLQENPFVSQIIQKAMSMAAASEADGKFLDAYTNCYMQLKEIYPDNRNYSDYADKLLNKANISTSLQDSPYRNSFDKYLGIKQQMFIKAIDTLNADYVVRIDDYSSMAIKAIRHCELLAEVMGVLYSEMSKSNSVTSFGNMGWKPINNKQLVEWSLGLSKILNEVRVLQTKLSKNGFLSVFEEIVALNSRTVALPKQVLIAHFAEGALSGLDPYTAIIWPNSVAEFKKQVNGNFTGIGIRFSKKKGLFTVASILLDTPAYYSDLKTGDVIMAVDGIDTGAMTADCVVKSITGEVGTKVTLTVRRPEEGKCCDITVTRAKITVPSVHGWQRTQTGEWIYMIDNRNKIGYIRIASFSSQAAQDFESALLGLESKGMKGLILDLRHNPGGLLDIAAEIVDKFIEKGMIVSTRPRYGMGTYISAHKNNTHPNYPIVVLVDRISASASEIVAGALQDKHHKRATLVGERTYGKGSVQNVKWLPGKEARLKFTMATYHLPSGQKVEKQQAVKKHGGDDWGIAPDIEVKLSIDELKKITNVQKVNEAMDRSNLVNFHNSVRRYSAQESINADPQLAIGLLALKSKIVQVHVLKSGQ